jgi:hypothetical protein
MSLSFVQLPLTDGSLQPTNLRISTRNPGFQKIGVKPGRGPNPGASSERSGPVLFVINGAQDPATLRVDQMRLSARKARHLNVGEVLVFGVISDQAWTLSPVFEHR